WLKTLYRKRAVTWPFIFYTIIWTLSLSKIHSPFLFLENVRKSKRIACFKDGTFFVFYLSDKNEVILLEINNCSN
ncbi:hypothetical protein, partial [Enterococcus faecium]|uniref:hypothetical protein n=1 Tax=Enterococcus faecium TaxID=1352 RepID=UPI002542A3A3